MNGHVVLMETPSVNVHLLLGIFLWPSCWLVLDLICQRTLDIPTN